MNSDSGSGGSSIFVDPSYTIKFYQEDTDTATLSSVTLNLRLIGSICNLVIFMVLGFVLANLVTSLNSFKSNREKMRKPLYKLSAAIIVNLIVIIFWQQMCLIWYNQFAIWDLFINISMFIMMILLFMITKETVKLHIYKKFQQVIDTAHLNPEKVDEKMERVFFNRIDNLARLLNYMTRNKAYASQFISRAKLLGTETIRWKEPNVDQTRFKFSECIYEAMLYKAGTVELGFCGMCCKRDFSKIGVEQAFNFAQRLTLSLKIFIGLDIILALGVAIYLYCGGDSNTFVILIESCISLLFSLVIVYLLVVAHRF